MSLRLRHRDRKPSSSSAVKEKQEKSAPLKKAPALPKKRAAPFDQIDERSIRNEDLKSRKSLVTEGNKLERK